MYVPKYRLEAIETIGRKILAPIPGETMSLSEIEQRLAEIDEEVRRVVAQTAAESSHKQQNKV